LWDELQQFMPSCHTLFALTIAGFLLGCPANAAKAPDCPAVYHTGDLQVSRPGKLSLPERDRSPYPKAKATVICSIQDGGHLKGCKSDLRDARGAALASYVSAWRVLTTHVGRCSVRGRKLTVPFQFQSAG